MTNAIQGFCKQYRQETIKMTLEKMQEITGVNAKTISSFENGYSSNLKLFTLYYKIGSAYETYKFHEDILKVLIR